jgi:ankyrin repeat protein
MKVVKLLLKNGADVNVKNKKGKTPLYPTCSEGHSEITRLLLKKGADMQWCLDGVICLRHMCFAFKEEFNNTYMTYMTL